MDLDSLLDDNAEVRFSALRAAMRTRARYEGNGAITPRSIRAARRFFEDRLPILIRRKREALGLPPLPVVTVPWVNYANTND
jgi:hypothetical protein